LIAFRSCDPTERSAKYLVLLIVLAVAFPLQPSVNTALANPTSQESGPASNGGGSTVSSGAGRFYGETGYTLAAEFVNFYDSHGGLAVFGYPVTDARIEEDSQVKGFLVQWTERQRLEWHPELAGTEFEVQLGLLGSELTRGLNGPNFQPAASSKYQAQSESGTPHYFPETGQYVDDLFYDYWVRNGGLRVFGYPISAECGMSNGECGITTSTASIPNSEFPIPNSIQWFERARFELHTENTPETRVLLGHLGYEALKARELVDYKFQVYPASSSGVCCPIQQTSTSEPTLQIGLSQGGESDDPGFFDNITEAGSALGPGLVRLDNIFNFYNIVQRAPDGTISYNWQQLDRELDAVRAMEKEPLINLSYMPETMSVTGKSRVMPPASYDEWAALVRATVTHVNVDRCGGMKASCPNRVTYWEVWNEPNLWSFWQAPYPDYLKLYDVTVQAAISADPTIKIGGPAVSYFSTDHLGEFLEHEAMQMLQGAPARLDFISWHSYGRSADQLAADIRQMRKILEGYPQFNPQLFITEFNILQGGSGDTSANGYSDTVEGAIAFLSSIESMQRERLDRAFLFELKDGPPPAGSTESFWGRWGILTYDGQPKPIYYALKAFQNRPPGMMPVSLLLGPSDGSLGMMAFGAPTASTLLLWYTGSLQARVKVALPKQLASTDFDVALFDHDTNNPAETKDEGRRTNDPSTPPSSFVLRPSSSVVNAGDLVFELKPYSLAIMTSR
jgi:hypothetical protein